MNSFNVGDEVRVKEDGRFVRYDGVITSISPCGTYLRFNNHKFGFDFRNYELVGPLETLSYEEML